MVTYEPKKGTPNHGKWQIWGEIGRHNLCRRYVVLVTTIPVLDLNRQTGSRRLF
ncbi:uncharacterized protein METZ01_LOCUS270867, partial [marine metagenome]